MQVAQLVSDLGDIMNFFKGLLSLGKNIGKSAKDTFDEFADPETYKRATEAMMEGGAGKPYTNPDPGMKGYKDASAPQLGLQSLLSIQPRVGGKRNVKPVTLQSLLGG